MVKQLLLGLILFSTNLYCQISLPERFSESGFFERAISFSPNGKYYSYHGIGKNDSINAEKNIEAKIVASSNLKSVLVTISYPYRFFCWRSDTSVILLNINNNSIIERNIFTKRETTLFQITQDISDSVRKIFVNFSNFRPVRFQFVNNSILWYQKVNESSANVFTLNNLGLKKELFSLKLNEYSTINDFDIDLNSMTVVGFYIDNNTHLIDMYKIQLKQKQNPQLLMDKIDIVAGSSSNIRFSDNDSNLILFRFRNTPNDKDSFFSYNINTKQKKNIGTLKSEDYWILDFNYNEKAIRPFVLNVLSDKHLYGSTNMANYDVFEKLISAIYLISLNK